MLRHNQIADDDRQDRNATSAPVDILVNNAGIQHVVHRSREFPIEQWDAIIAINLSSRLPATVRAAVPGMKK